MVPVDAVKLAVPVPTVSAPLTLKPLDAVTTALLAMVRLVKVSVPRLEIDDPLFIVIVPDDGLKFAVPDPTAKAPSTPKLLEVVTVALFAMLKSVNVSVPELEIDDPLFIVIVPLVGVNVPPTVKAPPTVAELPAPLIEPLILRPPYVKFERTCPAAASSTVRFVRVLPAMVYESSNPPSLVSSLPAQCRCR